MIFRQLSFTNFGIYGGNYSFDLAPIEENTLHRPVVLFRGKNGVGKSTILEAIRLCLHGPMAIGSRVSRTEYSRFLETRIHRDTATAIPIEHSEIQLIFDFANAGSKSIFQVSRHWRRAGGKVLETVTIVEDGKELSDLSGEQKEALLREMVSPSAAEIFFFDAEKLHTLAEDEASNELFAQTVKTLLGLDLVERLQTDLNVYVARQAKGNDAAAQSQLNELNRQQSTSEDERQILLSDQRLNRQSFTEIEKAISSQEQRISSEGNSFSDQRNTYKLRQQQLVVNIEKQRGEIQDLTSGLMPFAIAPQMIQLVKVRLHREHDYEQVRFSRQLISERVSQLSTAMETNTFWEEAGLAFDPIISKQLLAKIKFALDDSPTHVQPSSEEIILRVSEKERGILLDWIEQSLTSIPERFCQAIQSLSNMEGELKIVEAELGLIPSDDVLKPLMEELNILNQSIGALKQRDKSVTDRLRQLDYEIEQRGFKLRKQWQQIADSDNQNRRIQLAAKTQIVLDQYASELMSEKTRTLEQVLVECFNNLCRKENLIDGIKIDPKNFGISLYRANHRFERSELSAGEKQLLATAVMWALREVSRLPFPVIVDTPVGRLDTEHRLRMVTEYFPNASHQVVLLATDAEMDEAMVAELRPYISHQYDLQHDGASRTTMVEQWHFRADIDVEALDKREAMAL